MVSEAFMLGQAYGRYNAISELRSLLVKDRFLINEFIFNPTRRSLNQHEIIQSHILASINQQLVSNTNSKTQEKFRMISAKTIEIQKYLDILQSQFSNGTAPNIISEKNRQIAQFITLRMNERDGFIEELNSSALTRVRSIVANHQGIELAVFAILLGLVLFFNVIEFYFNERLEDIDKAKSEFISLASHQLRSPIVAIQWTLEDFFKKVKITQEEKKYFNNVFRAAKHLDELTKLLLSISRIESGAFKISTESFDLVEFIEGYIDGMQSVCKKKIITLDFTNHPESLEFKTDKNAFENILRSLASNALDYTKPGGEVAIQLEKKDNSIILTVKDNGIGIPKEEQSRIFKKFARASNAVNFRPAGTGLGLYIVREMVKLLNGKIWFESEENRGSVFYVELPA